MKKSSVADGQISIFDSGNVAFKADEPDFAVTELPLEWEDIFTSDAGKNDGQVDSIADALVMSLTTYGRVDIEYISKVTGEAVKSVIVALRGSIYQNPDTWGERFDKGWETSEEYLSGNLIRKLNAAEAANRIYPGRFKDNIEAIKRVLPDAVPTKDIYVTLGSPWVPTDIIDEFITYMLNLKRVPFAGTMHDEITGSWEIPNKSYYKYGVRSESTYGTPRLSALHILERTLNMKSVSVTDEIVSVGAGGKKRVINKSETVSALDKQAKMISDFQRWVWRDEGRRARLEEIFENKFSCVRRRIFDGSFLTFPTMSPSVKLYPYQKNAVARILFTPNTLLAHDVGSGKTYVMIAAGMERLRMGLSEKNMYVVPNNIVGQWQKIFEEMYPNCKLLVVEPKTFTPAKRKNVVKSIRDEKFDGIIIAYSCFKQIPLSKRYYINKLKRERAALEAQLKQQGKATTRLNKKRESIQKKLTELSAELDTGEDKIYFDELNITGLFVDEAHNFKNVPLDTKVNNVLGISDGTSQQCKEMLDKVRTVQRQTGGKGVVLATGTPITNSITDVFVMQQYLQSGELSLLDLQSFDSWLGMFAERITEFEIDVDTNSYRLATRFSKFHNLPELTSMLAAIADFHSVDITDGIPDRDGYNDALVKKSPELTRYLDEISRRADDVRRGSVDRKEDNMLKITTDGRKAALDIRLATPSIGAGGSKVVRCAENVADIYYRTSESKSAQLIFCDISTPKAGFNIYDELKSLLIRYGIPERQIAFIHDAETERKREKLFALVRNGDVRVLLGSTFKLGLGVNVQDRLIALHHLDVPWRPADMTQREGRILRQGNLNKKVQIFRYITEGSFDAYSWQLLETKARFIADLLSGSFTGRSGGDISDTVLDYAEVKALAVGNPLVKKRVETANELTRYLTLQRKLIDTRLHLEKVLMEIPSKRERTRELIEKCKSDIKYYEKWVKANPEPEDNAGKKREAEQRKALREKLHDALNANILETAERRLMIYKGFTIVLPSNMTPQSPFVYLEREGRYYVELGDTEVGNLQRIDNYLNGLGDHLLKMKERLSRFDRDEAEIRVELNKRTSYSDKIEACQKRLDAIDKKLGAKEK